MEQDRIITEVDRLEFERLSQLKTADMRDKHSAQELSRRYINPGEHICMHCDPQVQKLFKKIKTWWQSNKDRI
jgi:hypothetical protein